MTHRVSLNALRLRLRGVTPLRLVLTVAVPGVIKSCLPNVRHVGNPARVCLNIESGKSAYPKHPTQMLAGEGVPR